jgi:hypothetical protein
MGYTAELSFLLNCESTHQKTAPMSGLARSGLPGVGSTSTLNSDGPPNLWHLLLVARFRQARSADSRVASPVLLTVNPHSGALEHVDVRI